MVWISDKTKQNVQMQKNQQEFSKIFYTFTVTCCGTVLSRLLSVTSIEKKATKNKRGKMNRKYKNIWAKLENYRKENELLHTRYGTKNWRVKRVKNLCQIFTHTQKMHIKTKAKCLIFSILFHTCFMLFSCHDWNWSGNHFLFRLESVRW